jgi:acetylornithine deacetylase/succinyl-diaminopimelate desuccinylase-like protein
MAARLRSAGVDDVQVFKPAPRKGNLVARLRGTSARKPILLMAHLDVVEALASDWSFDPFKLTEKDGYFYGRGSGDDKFMAATFVANLIRYKQEGFTPNRDIILVLETDEEIGDGDALGIQLSRDRKIFACHAASGGVADEDADGEHVLTFWQAAGKARSLARAAPAARRPPGRTRSTPTRPTCGRVAAARRTRAGSGTISRLPSPANRARC